VETAKDSHVYQLKVALRAISPQIRRRIQIWENWTLDQVHRVLQISMGCENYYLYEFRAAGAIYRRPHQENGPEILNARQTRIHSVLSETGATFE
jgi:hypothetical protein